MKHKYQTKKANNLYVAFLLLLSLSFSGYAQNLITNGSAENEGGTAAQGVAIDDWTQVSGDWQLDPSSGTSSDYPTYPQEGSYYFNPGTVETAELTQTVDLTSYATDIDNGLVSFLFTGYVRGYNGNDSSNIKLEYLNSSDVVLITFDSGNITDTAWQTITNETIAPVNTRSVKITLTSIRNDGTGNDGYYDNLSLVKKDSFITTWQITTDNESITIPTNSSFTYDYTINWGDGTTEYNQAGDVTHTYTTAGTYTVSIQGNYPAIYFNDDVDNAPKLQTIESWGDIAWESFENAFYGCSNLILKATDSPDLSNVTNMSYMFSGATSFNGDLSDWDISNVTRISRMFRDATSFNGDISTWNTSNLTGLFYVFSGASSFNQDLSGWDTSNVTQMAGTFAGASSFNGDVSTWNTSKVNDMTSMFASANSFNQDLVTVLDGENSYWDISNVEEINQMFQNASSFNGDVSNWDTSSVTNLTNTFYGASSFNKDISGWDTSKVTSMFGVFRGATSFNQDLSTWDLSSVGSLYGTFVDSGLSSANYDKMLIYWSENESTPDSLTLGSSANYCDGEEARNNLTTAIADGGKGWTITDGGLDCFAESFMTTWKTTETNESITIPVNTLYSYNYNVDWGDGTIEENLTSGVTHQYTVAGTYTVSIKGDFPTIYFNNDIDNAPKLQTIESWGEVAWSSFENAFYGCNNVTLTATDAPDLSNVTDMSSMFSGATSFNGDISDWDTSKVTSMIGVFQNAISFNGNISNWDISSVEKLTNLFNNASSFNQDLSSWDFSKVTSISGLFANSSLNSTNYNKLLINWSENDEIANGLVLGSVPTNYCEGADARVNLVASIADGGKGWTITDEGLDCFAEAFITTWKTTEANESITIPVNTSYTYNYRVDWGDGTIEENLSNLTTHQYVTAGIYTVSIQGDFPTIYFNNDVENGAKLQTIESWGDIEWESFGNAFYGCSNVTLQATDSPDLSNVTDMSYMFSGTTSFNGDLSDWDTSNITNMNFTFNDATKFNQNISTWNTSKVTSMIGMFKNATSFNQDLVSDQDGENSYWDISNVTEINQMFQNATSFNGNISNWDTSSIENITSVFNNASSFNQNLSDWNTSNVLDMSDAFRGASIFNQDISSWDFSKVTSISGLFTNSRLNSTNYDKLLISWSESDEIPNSLALGTVSANYCSATVARANLIASIDDGGKGWTITDEGLDCFAGSFITTWETTEANESITIPVNTSYTYDYRVDWGDGTIEENLTTDATHQYTIAGTYTVSIQGNYPAIYLEEAENATNLQTIESWGDTAWESFEDAFYGCSNLILNTTDCPDLSNVTNMSYMFSGATSFNGDLSDWDISNVTRISRMFQDATSFNGDISTWNISNLKWLFYVFSGATTFNQDLSGWDTSNITDMAGTFAGASSFNGDVSTWNTSKVTRMTNMFASASSFNQDLVTVIDGENSYWDISNVTEINQMFQNASSFNGDISNWDTSNVTTLTNTFIGASSFNKDISGWDTSKVASMYGVFRRATSFNQDLSTWDLSSVGSLSGVFDDSGLSNNNYDKILIGWNANENTPDGLTLGSVPASYCNGEEARNNLIKVTADGGKGWSISDEGLDCDITWTGDTDTNWDDSTNWSDEGIPTSSHTVTIPANLTNYPTATTEVSFNTMTMETGATFIPEAPVTGTVTYNKSIPDTYWYFIGSSVVGATIEDFILNTPLLPGIADTSLVSLGTHNNDDSTPNWEYFTNTSTGTFTSGVGYTIKLSTASTVSFTGTVNHNDISIPVTRGTESTHFLLGNPFTSNINSATFISNNSDAITAQTMYAYEEGGYAAYNKIKTLDIAPSVGFIVQLNENDTASSVSFKADSRAHKANKASKQEAIPYFELFIENETNKKSTEVFYFSGATTGYDNGYDSELFGGTTYDFAVFTQLVSDNEGQKLAIQTLPDVNTSVIPVGIIAKAGEEITFSVEEVNLPEESTVYLEDTLTGEFTNLSENTYQTTIKESSNGIGQFYIHTSVKSLSTEDVVTVTTNISIYKSSDQEITISGLNGDANVSVYSLLGKKVTDTSINSNGESTVSLPTLSAGIYIVKVSSEFGEAIKKITLN